jgi:hypothetical protein
MSSIETTFTFGTEITFESLTLVPLLGTSSPEPGYDILDAALAQGTLRITEITESGSVPEIKVLNRGQRPVLIIDGEELVGAKQNRTVNLSILIPHATDVVVPVTCVEAGRWSHRSRSFASSSRTHFAAGRAAKSAQVSASLLREGVARADQSQVWQEIAAKSVRLSARSHTGAMSEMFEVQHEGIESFVRGLPIAESQVGAVFILDGTPMGVDLFDSPHTFRSLIPKIVRGYALDAIDRRSNPAARASSSTMTPHESATQFMRRVLDASRTPFAAPGLGETWRLFAPHVSGGGLTVDGNLVHMSAFLTQADSTLIPGEL